MKCRVILFGLVAIIASAGLAQPQAPDAPGSAAPTRGARKEARVVRVTGGLDCKLVATRVIEAADAAEKEHAPALVIVLDNARTYREDIVRDIVVRLKVLPVPIVVWDESPYEPKLHGTHVCRGEAMLMLAAGASGSRQPLSISPQEPESRTLPAKTDGGLVRADLREVLGPMVDRHKLPPEAVDLLVGSTKRLWWVAQEPAAGRDGVISIWRVVASDAAPAKVSGSEARELTRGVPATDKEVLSGLLGPDQVEGLFGATVRKDAGSMLLELNSRMPLRPQSTVAGGVEALASDVRMTYEQLKQILAASGREGRSSADQVKEAERVVAGVDAIDDRLLEYPEIAMLAPPDGVDAGAKATTNATAWRTKLKALKDRANKAIEKAKAK